MNDTTANIAANSAIRSPLDFCFGKRGGNQRLRAFASTFISKHLPSPYWIRNIDKPHISAVVDKAKQLDPAKYKAIGRQLDLDRHDNLFCIQYRRAAAYALNLMLNRGDDSYYTYAP